MRIELHCHSTCSDGADPPEAVGARARGRDVQLFSLTDHDTILGHEAAAAAFSAGVAAAAVRGVEISCDENGTGIHVLAFDAGGAWPVLGELLAQMLERRRARLRVIAGQLARRGVHIDVEEILAAAGPRAVGRPDLARALVAQGVVPTLRDAFTRYLYDGGAGDAPGHRLTLAEALAAGREAGARMSLAHPHLYGEDRARSLLRRYRDEGMGGIEAFYGPYTPDERARWARMGDELGLVCTGGSDRHTDEDLDLGIDIPDNRAAKLCAWLGREFRIEA